MSKVFVKRNEAGQAREEFFTGITQLLTEFSQRDLEKMRTILFNEIKTRRNVKDNGRGKLILPSGIIGKK